MKKAPEPRMVNVSTSMASLTLAADLANVNYPVRFTVYQSSKAALNMYTVNLTYELRDTPFKVNAVCPGYTQTDFTNHQGTSRVEEAGQRVVKYALIGQDGPTENLSVKSTFLNREVYPGNVKNPQSTKAQQLFCPCCST